jgi:glucose/arabinose dehydrogenase
MSGLVRSRISAALVLAFVLTTACGGTSNPPTSSGGTNPGGSITGSERLGWDQSAATADELARLKYVVYVDGVRSELADVTCATTASAAGYACSGRLPAMTAGTHTLELASYVDTGSVIESAKSSPLRVTVAGATSGSVPAAIADGDVIASSDGVRMRVEVINDALEDPASLAIGPDGKLFVGSRTGVLTIIGPDHAATTAPAQTGPILSLALSPAFDRDQYVYAIEAIASESQGVFRTARYRLIGDRPGERMVLMQNGPVAGDPAAALRFGPDGKLYAAFDDGGNTDAARRMSEWSGKLLRLESDGHTPEDQAAASPVYTSGLNSPRGFDFAADGSTVWIADGSADGSERLRVLAIDTQRPRRARQRATFALPEGLGASALAFHRGGAVPEFNGDLFIAARKGGYILRIRFGADDGSRPASTERLLEGQVGSVRALAIGTDGSIYFCTPTSLLRLVRVP